MTRSTEKKDFTRVNGIGLWNSWTRNFKTPLLACLDLLDNSFDAALHPEFAGKIHVSPLSFAGTVERSGIVIRNNSYKAVKSLEKVLEVYSSTKGKRGSVGENGVGLKQGCATLSDLSFVLSKHDRTLELGVIAAALQQPEGVRLPSVRLTYDDAQDVDMKQFKAELETVVSADVGIRNCVEAFGGGCFDVGLEELRKQCRMLLSSTWGDNAFSVIITDLTHGNNNENASQSTRMKVSKAQGLLDEIKKELPRFYIHIPPLFECVINKDPVIFSYWQKRLVELSSFQFKIDKKNDWSNYSKQDEEKWKSPKEGYPLKMYIGFDPLRASDKQTSNALSVFVYSRQSGRLIKHLRDARAQVKLTNSGTVYAQGLTLIVDDRDGELPLNPTKQDIAFGEEEYGSAHEENLFSWMSACVFLFWNHHAEKTKMKKRELGMKVLAYANAVSHLVQAQSRDKVTLDQLDLTTFRDIRWARTDNHFSNTIHIRLAKRVIGQARYLVLPGRSTQFRINRDDESNSPEITPKKRKRSKSREPAPSPSTLEQELPDQVVSADTVVSNDQIEEEEIEKTSYPRRKRVRTEHYTPTAKFHLPHVVTQSILPDWSSDEDKNDHVTPDTNDDDDNDVISDELLKNPELANPIYKLLNSGKPCVEDSDTDLQERAVVLVQERAVALEEGKNEDLQQRITVLEKELEAQVCERFQREREFQSVLKSITEKYEIKLFSAKEEAAKLERLLKAAVHNSVAPRLKPGSM